MFERGQYFILMLGCVLLTLPLEFAFGARVWRQPKRLLLAIMPGLLVFVAWDIWATHRGTWGFSDRYTIGLKLPGGVVVEELLFFVVIPICALLTLESVRNVLAGDTPVHQWLRGTLMPIYPTLALVAAAVVVVLELTMFRSGIFATVSYWLSMVIVFGFMILVDGWLTKLSAPIVIYNDADTSGVRPIWDIVIEEYVYTFALLTLVILVWDRVGRDRGVERDAS